MSFTPGPWTAENVEEEIGLLRHKYTWKVTCADGVVNTVARMGLVDGGPAVVAANARLVAKTPDLYLILREIVNFHDGDRRESIESLIQQARRVLAEAVDHRQEGA